MKIAFLFLIAANFASADILIGNASPMVQQELRLTLDKSHCRNAIVREEAGDLESKFVLNCLINIDREVSLPEGSRVQVLLKKGTYEDLPGELTLVAREDTDYGKLRLFRVEVIGEKIGQLKKAFEAKQLQVRFAYQGVELSN